MACRLNFVCTNGMANSAVATTPNQACHAEDFASGRLSNPAPFVGDVIARSRKYGVTADRNLALNTTSVMTLGEESNGREIEI